MTTSAVSYQIHSEAHGPHWVAWVTRAGSQKPERDVVLVAANQEDAEERARRFADEVDRQVSSTSG